MNKYVVRSIALLLLPCLIVDPATASSLLNSRNLYPTSSVYPLSINNSRFQQEALEESPVAARGYAIVQQWLTAWTQRLAAGRRSWQLVRTAHGGVTPVLSKQTFSGLRVRGKELIVVPNKQDSSIKHRSTAGSINGNVERIMTVPSPRSIKKEDLVSLFLPAFNLYNMRKTPSAAVRDWFLPVPIHLFSPVFSDGEKVNNIAFLQPRFRWSRLGVSINVVRGFLAARKLVEGDPVGEAVFNRLVYMIIKAEMEHSRLFRLPVSIARLLPAWVPFFSWEHDVQDEIAHIKDDLGELHYSHNQRGLLEGEKKKYTEMILATKGLEDFRAYLLELDQISTLSPEAQERAIRKMAEQWASVPSVRTLGGKKTTPSKNTPPSVEIINPEVVRDLDLRGGALLIDFDDTIWTGYPPLVDAQVWAEWANNTDTPSRRQVNRMNRFIHETAAMGYLERGKEWTAQSGQRVRPEDLEWIRQQIGLRRDEIVRREGRTSPKYLTPGIADVLAPLKPAGVELKVVSGGSASTRKGYAIDLGVDSLFTYYHGGGNKQSFIKTQVDKYGIGKVAMIEDADRGIQAAKAAGAVAIGYAATLEDRERLIIAGADIIINRDFTAKSKILEALNLGYLTSKGAKLRSPEGGLWGILAAPGSVFEALGSWILAKVVGYHPQRPMIGSEGSYVVVPEVKEKLTDFKTFFLAVAFPILWAILTTWSGFKEWHLVTSHPTGVLILPMVVLAQLFIQMTPSLSGKVERIFEHIMPRFLGILLILELIARSPFFGLSDPMMVKSILVNFVFLQSAVKLVFHVLGWRTPAKPDDAKELFIVRTFLGLRFFQTPAFATDKLRSPEGNLRSPASGNESIKVVQGDKESLRNVLDNPNDSFAIHLAKPYMDAFGDNLRWYIDRLVKSTAGVRGVVQIDPKDILSGRQLNGAVVLFVAQAYADYINENYPKTVDGRKIQRAAFVGYDERHFSKEFAEIFTRVFVANGIKVYRDNDNPETAGEPTSTATPVSSYVAFHFRLASAIEITASHNPPNQTGVKSQSWTGGVDLDSISEIIAQKANDLFQRALDGNGVVHVGSVSAPEIRYVNAKEVYYENYWKRIFTRDRMRNMEEDLEKTDCKVLLDGLYGVAGPTFRYYLTRMILDYGLDAELWQKRILIRNDQADPNMGGLKKPDPSDPNTLALAGDLDVLVQNPSIRVVSVSDMDGDRIGTATIIPQKDVDRARRLGLFVSELSDGKGSKVYAVRFTPNQIFTLEAYGRALEAIRTNMGYENLYQAKDALVAVNGISNGYVFQPGEKEKLQELRKRLVLITTVPTSMITKALMDFLGGRTINCCVGFKYLGDQAYELDKAYRKAKADRSIIISILEESGGAQIGPVDPALQFDADDQMSIHRDKDTLTETLELFFHAVRLDAKKEGLLDFYSEMAQNLGGLLYYERLDAYLPNQKKAESLTLADQEEATRIKEEMAKKAEALEQLPMADKIVELFRPVYGADVVRRGTLGNITVDDAVFLLKDEKTNEWANVHPQGVEHILTNNWRIQVLHIGSPGKEGPVIRIFDEHRKEIIRTAFRKSGTESLVRLYMEIFEPTEGGDPHHLITYFTPLIKYLGLDQFSLEEGGPNYLQRHIKSIEGKYPKATTSPVSTPATREERLTRAEHHLRRPIVGGNWKMAVDSHDDAEKLIEEIADAVSHDLDNVEVFIVPSSIHLFVVAQALREYEEWDGIPKGLIHLAAQDISAAEPGAQTGQNSYKQYKALGVTHVIIGHSEQRRGDLKQLLEKRHTMSNEVVNAKVKIALKNGLTPVVCVGETLEEYEIGRTEAVLTEQIKKSLEGLTPEQALKVVIAYEPIWAIGTGKTASPDQANKIQRFIRGILLDTFGDEAATGIRIQYGGSMKPDNAEALMSQPNVDGGLIGGAALKAKEFVGILQAADKSFPANARVARDRSGRLFSDPRAWSWIIGAATTLLSLSYLTSPDQGHTQDWGSLHKPVKAVLESAAQTGWSHWGLTAGALGLAVVITGLIKLKLNDLLAKKYNAIITVVSTAA